MFLNKLAALLLKNQLAFCDDEHSRLPTWPQLNVYPRVLHSPLCHKLCHCSCSLLVWLVVLLPRTGITPNANAYHPPAPPTLVTGNGGWPRTGTTSQLPHEVMTRWFPHEWRVEAKLAFMILSSPLMFPPSLMMIHPPPVDSQGCGSKWAQIFLRSLVWRAHPLDRVSGGSKWFWFAEGARILASYGNIPIVTMPNLETMSGGLSRWFGGGFSGKFSL